MRNLKHPVNLSGRLDTNGAVRLRRGRVRQLQRLIKHHGIQACKVALLVGSVLIVINQFNAISGDEPFRWLPAVLTYLVPFCVFLWGRSKGP